MTAAIIYAFASACFLGAGVVLAQSGLRTVEPLSGAAISVPSFTLLFLLLSPLILQGEPVVWRGLPIFVAIGLFFPAALTLLTFASNRALGPVDHLDARQSRAAVCGGAGRDPAARAAASAAIRSASSSRSPVRLIITVTRPRDFGDWRSWALLLPLCSALMRGVVPPIVKLGLEVWPSPLWACLIGYMMSSLVVLTVQRVRNGSFRGAGAARGPVLVRDDRHQQRLERAHAVRRRPQRPDHAGGAAGRDLSARHGGAERDACSSTSDHRRIVGGTVLTVPAWRWC